MGMIYLSKFGGTGTYEDPFVPWISTILETSTAIIDLRQKAGEDPSLCASPDGWCLVYFEGMIPLEHPSLVPLVDEDSLDQPAPDLPAIFLEHLGVELTGEYGDTASELFADLLINHYGLQTTSSHGGYVAFLNQITLFDIPTEGPQ